MAGPAINAENAQARIYNVFGAFAGQWYKPDPDKARVKIGLDIEILDFFEGVVNEAGGGNFQTLKYNVLRDRSEATDETLEKKLSKIIRQSMSRPDRAKPMSLTD